MIAIVLGTGFGDEGKGQCVHALSSPSSLVIRFSGGHQCGHTVVTSEGKRHIFSQFGAGTFQGAATYLSAYCTVFPTAWVNEYKALETVGIVPTAYYVHPMAMVTTPYDLALNRALSMINGHGTCGVGFGSTLQRNEDFHNLYAIDLQTPYLVGTKLHLIKDYVEQKVKMLNMSSQITYEHELAAALENWEECLEFYRRHAKVSLLDPICGRYSGFIFEGSQGIMLDQHFGFFPHVTRSNTTSENAMAIIRNSVLRDREINTYYMSRCYLTRHGNGPFPETNKVELINTSAESNQENDWQGVFRTARFDPSLVAHAIQCDAIYNLSGKKQLVLTCLDQLKHKEAFVREVEESVLPGMVDKIAMKGSPDWTFE